MRYELHVRNSERKAISFLEGDEFVVDQHEGELCFFREGRPMTVVHAGFPYGTGTSKIQIKFQFRNNSAMIFQEVEELARIISALTWFNVERISPDGANKVRYRFVQADGSRMKVEVKDLLVIDTLYGGITLKKGGALYLEGSSRVEDIKLGTLYSFIYDEVFGSMQLISAITRQELIFSKEVRGVITYYCSQKISYENCYEEEVVTPYRRSSAA